MVFGDKIKNRICKVLLVNLIICLGLIFDSPNAYAVLSDCKSPVDVVLVLDKSASMAGVKFGLTKQAFSDFIFRSSDTTGLFATTPDSSYAPNDYHQIGLIGYNNNVSSWALAQNYSYIISVINDPAGQFQSAVGSRNVTLAVNQASGNLSANDNVVSPNIMIISLSGAPDDLTGAINAVRNAVNSGVRVVTVGIALNEISIAAQKQQAINFIKNEYVYSGDCYYVTSSTEDSITDCNNINQGALAENLGDFISQAVASVCDEAPPVIDSVIKTPPGTTYNIDKIRIISTAHDDSGFTEHYISWSDNWPNDQRIYDSCSLSGRNISCQTEEIGPFSIGTLINFRSTVKDTNGNQVTLDPPAYAKVATASIPIFTVTRNKGNTITATISDPMGFATGDEFYIRVDNGTAQRVIDENNSSSKMTCAGTGLLSCAYSIEPGCAADGSYINGTVDVYVYAKTSGAFHAGGFIAKSLGVNIQNGTESSAAGTCADSKDNDCDGLVDMAELQCDSTSPALAVTRDPSGDVYDKTGTGVPQNITFTSQATDSNGIKKNIIIYREVSTGFSCDELSALNSKFICEDANMDGKCDSDVSKLVGNLILDIGSKTAGTGISYCAEAFDWNNNEKKSSSYSFAVKSRECEGISDLGACNITPNAKCCSVVCDNTLTNPGGYTVDSDPNKTCAKQACNGMSWEYAQDRSGLVCRDSLDEDGCYELTTGSGGCEIRSYKCNAGKCLHTDNESWNGCDPTFSYLGTAYPLTWKVFQCNAASCELNPYPPDLNNPACDTSFDFITMDAYNSDSQLVAGSSGASAGDVHDNKTNKVKLKSKVNDARGVSFHKIYWKVNAGSWSNKDCGTCANGVECECLQEIGPFVVGDIVNFYVEAKDNSVNKTYRRLPATAGTYYSFTARDNRCFDIPGGNKANMTSCEAGGGRCCGGTCDTTKSNPSLYNNDCQNDGKCAGTSWEADIGNNGGACGSSEQCFWYYTGCFEGGNKCSSGFCSSVAESAKKVTTCWGANLNHLEDYACDFIPNPDECNNVNTDIDCSVAGTFDGDSVACNCNCGGYDVEERFGSSLSFDGKNDYADFGDVLDANANSFSVEMWFNWDGKSGNNILYNKESLYEAQVSGGYFTYAWQPSWAWYGGTSFSVNSGEWYHVVVVYDKNKQYVYKNGNLTPVYSRVQTGDIGSNSNKLLIGARGNIVPYDYFGGSIDEVRVYNRALYPEEIMDHYNGVYFDNTGLMGYWDFNEISTETAEDLSGNNNDGTFSNIDAVLNNGASLDNGGKYGKGIKLDGNNDYANISGNAPLGSSAYTVALWIKPDVQSEYLKGIVGKNGRNYNIWLGNADVIDGGFIRHRFHDSLSTDSGCPDTAVGSIKTDEWNYVVITNDGITCKTYINDGVAESSGSVSGSLISENGTTHIGSNLDTGAGNYYKGK
ncbi:MAG: LamG-like jellyroll fold domain-containing protein, partial [Minisyncoccia bacterium]